MLSNNQSIIINSPHSSVGRARHLKTRNCGFDSRTGHTNRILLIVFRMRLYTKVHCDCVIHGAHYKEPSGAVSSFVLYPCTFSRVTTSLLPWGLRSDGQPVATINKRRETKQIHDNGIDEPGSCRKFTYSEKFQTHAG